MDTISHVLIAEDDKDDYEFLVEGLKLILPEASYQVATNGAEAFRLVKNGEEKPQLIFLDLNMPVKGGVETLKAFKQSEAFADIPVVVYSTSHYLKDIHTSYVEGAYHYIIKPTSLEALSIVLNKLFLSLGRSNERPGKNDFVIREKSLRPDHELEESDYKV